MGFFSQDCHGCGHPALSSMATEDLNKWMTDVVAITPNGSIYIGRYDGYGRVNDIEYAVGERNTVWHQACWEVAGKPTDYQGESRYSADQGWFYEDGVHNLPDPRMSGKPIPYATDPATHTILGEITSKET